MGEDHNLIIKKLLPVHFSHDKSSTSKTPSAICPSCMKTLTTSSKLVLLKSCGHVICQGCVTKFVKPAGKCFVCNGKCKEKDVISLSSEGTGFASGGQVEAKRFDLAFQA
jgi:nitric oxide synthase-interacting protein